jgi:hypothetical protein
MPASSFSHAPSGEPGWEWACAACFPITISGPGRKRLIVGSLLVAAAAICGAVFLLVEMHYPYGGYIQVSSAPLHTALAQLGKGPERLSMPGSS